MDDEGPVAFRIFNPDRTDAVADPVARPSDALPLSWVVCSTHAAGLSDAKWQILTQKVTHLNSALGWDRLASVGLQ